MRLDLHIHTHHSRDSLLRPRSLIEACQRRALDAVAITDHNTIQGALEAREMAPFLVIVGEEVKTTEGEVIGLFLEEEIPRGLSPEETVGRIKAQGGLVYIPHPFDRLRRSPLKTTALERLLPQVDIIEAFNARVIFPGDNRRAAQFAKAKGILVGAGSDGHTACEVGQAYVEMPPWQSKEEFLKSLARARVYGSPSSPAIHFATSLIKAGKSWRLIPR